MPNVKTIRKKKNMTQMELAASSGVKQTTISDIERGVIKSPTLDTARALSKALGAKLERVFPPTEAERVAS